MNQIEFYHESGGWIYTDLIYHALINGFARWFAEKQIDSLKNLAKVELVDNSKTYQREVLNSWAVKVDYGYLMDCFFSVHGADASMSDSRNSSMCQMLQLILFL